MTYQAPELTKEQVSALLSQAVVTFCSRDPKAMHHSNEIKVECGEYFGIFDTIVFSMNLCNIPDDMIRGAALVEGMREIAENSGQN